MRATQSHIIIIIVVAVVVGQGEWKSGRAYETIRLYADYYTYDARWLRDAMRRLATTKKGTFLLPLAIVISRARGGESFRHRIKEKQK